MTNAISRGTYGDHDAPVDLVLAGDYPSFLAVGEGRLDPGVFVADHLEVVAGGEHAPAFLAWLGAALDAIAPDAAG